MCNEMVKVGMYLDGLSYQYSRSPDKVSYPATPEHETGTLTNLKQRSPLTPSYRYKTIYIACLVSPFATIDA
jgi:hypothetical protein